MAVLFLALILGACVTPSQIDELKGDIAKVRSDNLKTQQLLMRMDSLMSVQTESSVKLRNDMSYTSSELQRQIGTLLENYNEMMTQINQISGSGRVTHVVKSSKGATENT